MSISLGMEAIDFQHNSQAAIDLIKVFQDVIDYRDSLSVNDDREVERLVIKYCNNVMAKNFVDTVSKRFNLNIDKLFLTKYPTLYFAVLPIIGDDYITHYIMQNTEGGTPYKHSPTTAKELEEITNTFDKENSRLGKTDFNLKDVNEKLSIKCNIYMDPYSFFLSKECIHKKFQRVSAKHIASVMLHEIGHVFLLVERANHSYQVMDSVNKSILYFNKYASIDEKIKYAKNIDKKELPENIDKKQYETVINTIDNLNKELEEGLHLNISQKLFSLMTMVLCVPAYIVNAVDKHVTYEFMKLFESSKLLYDVKRSDKPLTDQIGYSNERNADEFVTRHGLGSSFAEAMSVFSDYYSLGELYTFYTSRDFVRDSIYMLILFRNKYLGSDVHMTTKYETEIDRMKRLKQNNIKAFKDFNLPEELVNYYIREHENLENVINQQYKLTRFKESNFGRKSLELFHYFISAGSLVSVLSNGKLTKEYTKLMNIVDELSSSPLYYKAAKLSQLSN